MRANFDAEDNVSYMKVKEPSFDIVATEKGPLQWGKKYQINVFATVQGSNEPLSYQALSFTMPAQTSFFTTFVFYVYTFVALTFAAMAAYFWRKNKRTESVLEFEM